MSQFTSTFIDDESLIHQLRLYGEPNLPSASSNEINSINRDIYLKKLNHYKAKEKARMNPSKQFKKQQQLQHSSSNNSNIAAAAAAAAARNNVVDSTKKECEEIDLTNEDLIEMAHTSTSPLQEYPAFNVPREDPKSNG